MIKNTLNTLYSYSYHQPEDYRFSLDSVFLAQKVAWALQEEGQKPLKVLDLCSGCGVVGLELNFHNRSLNKIDFLEVQEVYRQYFDENAKKARTPESEFRFLNENYEVLLTDHYKESYDIIVSNPPYFFVGEGLLSPNNDFKNRCRFFIDSSLEKLIHGILNALRPGGRAFLLARPGTHHGRNLHEEIKKLSSGLARVQIFDEVRGTNIVELVKES